MQDSRDSKQDITLKLKLMLSHFAFIICNMRQLFYCDHILSKQYITEGVRNGYYQINRTGRRVSW